MKMKTFDGYDAQSPTLQPSPLYGDCMRGIIGSEFTTVYTDRAAPIRSGDFVRLWIQYPDMFAVIVKRLRVSRNGRWWAECQDGVFELGHLVLPFAIEKVVALSTEVLMHVSSSATYRKATTDEAEAFARHAAAAVFEWEHLGHLDGVPFPGLDVLNYEIPGTGQKSPTWRAPEPL